jgi:hypothetical protein
MANKLPYFIGFGMTVISFILCMIAYGTGYWFVSIDPDNLFQSIGLWQACFNGYEHTSDLIGKAYYGCWWIFYKEYYYIRDWLMPPWFIAVQTMMTFAVVFEFLTLGLYPLAGADADNTRILGITCCLNGLLSACLTTSVVIFGVMIGEDRTWMPRYDVDRLGWSYGLAVVSGFMSIFSTIAITTYTLMRKYELLPSEDAPKRAPMIPKV